MEWDSRKLEKEARGYGEREVGWWHNSLENPLVKNSS